jgi:hypothetical protein
MVTSGAMEPGHHWLEQGERVVEPIEHQGNENRMNDPNPIHRQPKNKEMPQRASDCSNPKTGKTFNRSTGY